MTRDPAMNIGGGIHARLGAASMLLGVLSALAAFGQGPEPRSAPVRKNEFDLQAYCRSAAIQAAVSKLPAGVTVSEAKPLAASGNLPARCQVAGSFVTNPQTARTASFLASLPAEWNGKYLQTGRPAPCDDCAAGTEFPAEAIVKGYAAFTTGDAGLKVDDHIRANRILAAVGKAITASFYGQAGGAPKKISRSYFVGCSGGGGQVLIAAAVYPEEFDGFIAGAPYVDPGGLLPQEAAVKLRFQGSGVPAALMSQAREAARARCDAADGIRDGLIQNPAACDFRPERDLPRCGASPAGACFTQAQVETISVLLTAVTGEDGTVVQPGYPAGGEFRAKPLLGIAGDGLPEIRFATGGPGAVAGFRAIVPRTEVSARPDSLGRLIQRNRKLLIWHGLGDPIVTPYLSINYYKRLAKTSGGYATLQNNVRLFTVPGVADCGTNGGFDALAAMEAWVEKGQPPDALVAVLSKARTIPLCKFPEMARYRGHGNVNDAANWSCPADDRSMLKIGESGRQAGVID